MKRIYVAGPIGAVEGREERVRTAIAFGEQIRRAGLYPFIPHLNHFWDYLHPGHHYECWMKFDFHWLEQCEALFRVPGPSPGADREVAHAIKLNIPVFIEMDALIEWAKGVQS